MDWVRLSADVALLTFLVAWLLRVYAGETQRAPLERWAYGLGGLLMVFHVLIAYSLFHGWSHAAALAHTAEQTERVVGRPFAGGLYFNFLFVAVYLTDIVWRCRCGGWKQRRPLAIAYTIDLFLWYIVAMSTIVFETGVVRVFAVAGSMAVLFGIWRSHMRKRKYPSLLLMISVVLAGNAVPEQLIAGGGPENVVVLVNSRSAASKRIANFYVALRDIPDVNLIYLDNVPETESTGVETFRDSILIPTIEAINSRRLAARIDYLVYSADFPTAIQVQADVTDLDIELPKVLTKTASINGLTFFAGLTIAKNPSYLSLDANFYASQTADQVLQRCYRGRESETLAEAIDEYNNEHWEEALKMLRELASVNQQQPALHYWIARCEAKRNRLDEAIDALESAIANGWCFRDFTQHDKAFADAIDNPRFVNLLERMPETKLAQNQSREFRSSVNWAPNGMRVSSPQFGSRFFLSTVLAVTRGAGTTEAEAIANLQRAHDADFTQPDGRFYFALTGDIRTRTRQPGFESAINELKRIGWDAEIIEETLPQHRGDIAGLMIGAANYQWAEAKSRILPGAICENLTSFGGKMDQPKGQTKLTDLLLAGAAGSSGTVTEPYAIQAKFPHPSIQVHYARGSSLAEAFYQSVSGPYQLLIVGDPLCQPWAIPPEFELTGLQPDQSVEGPVKCKLIATGDIPIAQYEIFMDGRFSGSLLPGQPLSFNSASLADGYHELRVVAFCENALLTQGRMVVPFVVDNQQQSIDRKNSGGR